MAGALGADVHGVDLARPLDDATFGEIERAFHDRLVLFFHDQRLTPEQHLAFSRRLGPLVRSPYIKHMDEYPDIIAVLKEADERNISIFGNAWHSDFSFLEEPPLGSVLYAREVPAYGGDTLFANMYSAYEALSEGMRWMLDGLNAMHAGRPYGVGGVSPDLGVSRSIGIERNRPEADREIAHPVVRIVDNHLFRARRERALDGCVHFPRHPQPRPLILGAGCCLSAVLGGRHLRPARDTARPFHVRRNEHLHRRLLFVASVRYE